MMVVEGHQLTEDLLMLYRQLLGQMALRDYTRCVFSLKDLVSKVWCCASGEMMSQIIIGTYN